MTGAGFSYTAQVPVFVRSAFNTGSGSSLTCDFPANTGGNLLVVGVQGTNGGVFSVSDGAGNTYTGLDDVFADLMHVQIFYAPNCINSSGTNTVTFNNTGGGTMQLAISEWAKCAALAPCRTSSGNSDSTLPASPGNMTTAINDLVIGWISGPWSNNDFAPGAGYNKVAGNGTCGLMYKLATTTPENPSASGTPTAHWAAAGATFRPGP